MASHDERIESLMNRSLDRDLSEAEQLELDRTLIRSPEIRREYEQMRRIDSLAAEALRAMVPEDQGTPVPNPEAGARRSQGGARKLWWLLPAAAELTPAQARALWTRSAAPVATPAPRPLDPDLDDGSGRRAADSGGGDFEKGDVPAGVRRHGFRVAAERLVSGLHQRGAGWDAVCGVR
jgi:anti-sigma factor RsiW